MTRDRSKDIEFLDMPLPVAILAALSACLVLGFVGLRVFFMALYMPSSVMAPAVPAGHFIVVHKFAYAHDRPIRRGDVVVIRPRGYWGSVFAMRVVAVGGDKVQMVDGRLILNGAAITAAPHGRREVVEDWGATVQVAMAFETTPDGVRYEVRSMGETPGDNTQIYTIPEGDYFVLGDNRDNASDSRFEMEGFGPVARDEIRGKVVRVIRFGAGEPKLSATR